MAAGLFMHRRVSDHPHVRRLLLSRLDLALMLVAVLFGCSRSHGRGAHERGEPDAGSPSRSMRGSSPGSMTGDASGADSAAPRATTAELDAAANDARIIDAATLEEPLRFRAVQVAAGYGASCAVTDSGSVVCWGPDNLGMLGHDARVGQGASLVPVSAQLPANVRALQVAAAQDQTCAVSDDGDVYCWGANFSGELGIGSKEWQELPARVMRPPGVHFTAVDAAYKHSCAVSDDGDVYCWGENGWGQLGDGILDHGLVCGSDQQPIDCSSLPVQVEQPDGERFVTVSLGDLHSCALTESGRAYCWGRSGDGQLGAGAEPMSCPIAGDDVCSTVPVAVALPDEIRLTSIAAGTDHCCGTTAAGEVYCWGRDYNGQLGVGEPVARRTVPVLASALGGLSIHALAAGSHFTCGIADSGAAYCWGTDELGQLGDGPVEHDKGTCGIVCSPAPVQVMGSESADYVAIAATYEHVCAVTRDGGVQCWGAASFGRLGNGSDEHEECTISNGEMEACERAPVAVVGSGE